MLSFVVVQEAINPVAFSFLRCPQIYHLFYSISPLRCPCPNSRRPVLSNNFIRLLDSDRYTIKVASSGDSTASTYDDGRRERTPTLSALMSIGVSSACMLYFVVVMVKESGRGDEAV